MDVIQPLSQPRNEFNKVNIINGLILNSRLNYTLDWSQPFLEVDDGLKFVLAWSKIWVEVNVGFK